MHTILVWVLVLPFHVYYGKAPLVVDNIASQGNCRGLAHALQAAYPYDAETAKCIAVRKVVP